MNNITRIPIRAKPSPKELTDAQITWLREKTPGFKDLQDASRRAHGEKPIEDGSDECSG